MQLGSAERDLDVDGRPERNYHHLDLTLQENLPDGH